MLNKQIPFFVLIFFATLSCQTSIPITIHGVTPEEYFQGKKNLDSAYVSENYPLYQRWYLVSVEDVWNDSIKSCPMRNYSFSLRLTNEPDSIKPQYLSYRFIYTRSNSRYYFRGIYEFSTAGNIYISDVIYKQQYFTSYSWYRNITEEEAWLWELIISADRYTLDGDFLTLFSKDKVLVFINRPISTYNRQHKNRNTNYQLNASQ